MSPSAESPKSVRGTGETSCCVQQLRVPCQPRTKPCAALRASPAPGARGCDISIHPARFAGTGARRCRCQHPSRSGRPVTAASTPRRARAGPAVARRWPAGRCLCSLLVASRCSFRRMSASFTATSRVRGTDHPPICPVGPSLAEAPLLPQPRPLQTSPLGRRCSTLTFLLTHQKRGRRVLAHPQVVKISLTAAQDSGQGSAREGWWAG